MNKVDALNEILDTDNVSDQVGILTNVFISCLDTCAPVVRREITRPPAPWMTDNIKETMKIRDKLKSDLKRQSKNIPLRERYKNLKKKVNSQIADGRKQYYKQEFLNAKGDVSATWKITNNMLFNGQNRDKNKFLTDTENNILSKAEEFNDFFAEVGKKNFRENTGTVEQ